MRTCAKAINERCARIEGHTAGCRCTYFELYDQTRAALETLVREIQAAGHDFRERKAVQVARKVLERTPLTDEEEARRDEEWRRQLEQDRSQHERDRAIEDPEAYKRGEDARRGVRSLFANLKGALPDLEKLLAECSSHWGYEDPVYRLYHRSFKVYRLQETTTKIVAALQALAPRRRLNREFLAIVAQGTGREFQMADNDRWLAVTRPMVEAFFHARFLLEMAVQYGRELETPPASLPSGWAALLYLYELR